MSEITSESVIDFLKSVANDPVLSEKKNPQDKGTGNCLYHDGQGNYCLVGYWLVDQVGVEAECLELIEGDSASIAIDKAMLYGWLSSISPKAIYLLNDAQEKADVRDANSDDIVYNWGEAIGKLDFPEYIEN